MAKKKKESAPINGDWESLADPAEEKDGPDPPTMRKFEKDGEMLEGIFLSTRTIRIPGRKDSQGRNKASSIHKFVVDNSAVETWGTAMLDRLLSMVKRGQPVRIVYGGKVAMEGGSSKHVFTVAAKPASPATMETIKAIEPF